MSNQTDFTQLAYYLAHKWRLDALLAKKDRLVRVDGAHERDRIGSIVFVGISQQVPTLCTDSVYRFKSELNPRGACPRGRTAPHARSKGDRMKVDYIEGPNGEHTIKLRVEMSPEDMQRYAICVDASQEIFRVTGRMPELVVLHPAFLPSRKSWSRGGSARSDGSRCSSRVDDTFEIMFDPSTNAAVLVALKTRVDTTFPMQSASFTLASADTRRMKGDSIYQRSFVINPSGSRVAIAWSAVYRMQVLNGTLIVVNTINAPLATCMLLTEATQALDLIDLKQMTKSDPNSLYPATAPGYR